MDALRAKRIGALGATVIAAAACTAVSPTSGPESTRPPGSLCAGFPIGEPMGWLCGSLEHFSTDLSTFPDWRYIEKPRIQRAGARRATFDGVLVAPDQDVGGIKDHYRFAFLNQGAPLNWEQVGTSLAGSGRTLTFVGKDRVGTYRLVLSLRQLPGERVRVEAQVDATLRPRT